MNDRIRENSERRARRAFAILIALSILLMGALLFPFWEALIMAAVVAGALYPLQIYLQKRLRGRPRLAALSITLALVLLLLVPLGGITAVVARELVDGSRFVAETLKSAGVVGLIDSLPRPLQRLTEKIFDTFPQLEQTLETDAFEEQVGSQTGKAAAAVGGVVSATGSVLLQTVMFLIAFYFLLLDGRRLVAWLSGIMPLKNGQTIELLTSFRTTAVSVLSSTIATSAVQAVAALVGYLIARVPQPFFFALVTFVIAFVPSVGAGSVCLTAALLLFLMGKTGWAIFLAIWAVLVVGLVDNVVKPLLIRSGMELHGVVVFFSLLGGLATFGAVGLVLGPLIVAFFMALVKIYRRDFDEERIVGVEGEPGQPP